MSEKVNRLVAYFDMTLELMHNNHISNIQGKKILDSLEPEFTNKKEIYQYLQYYNSYKFDYWYDFLFAKNEDAVNYLKEMTKENYASKRALEKIIDRFLDMPQKIRKEFYQTNFASTAISEKRHIDYIKMCKEDFALAEPNTIFHNLPTLYILTATVHTNDKIVEKIISDIKNVLKLNNSAFLDIYGNALIHTLDNQYIYKKWKELELDKRKDFQESFATRLIYRGVLKFDAFESLLEKNLLPYDLKYPRGNNYLMSALIEHKLNKVTEYLRTTPFSHEELKIRMQKTKEDMIKINEKYDLYFFNHSRLEKNNQTMSANFTNHFKHKLKDKSEYAKMEGEILKYQFEIDDIFKKRELVQKKKIKL